MVKHGDSLVGYRLAIRSFLMLFQSQLKIEKNFVLFSVGNILRFISSMVLMILNGAMNESI